MQSQRSMINILEQGAPVPPIKKPLVMQVLPTLEQGGVERTSIDIAKALTEDGFRAIVVSKGGPMVKELHDAGILHIPLAVDTKNPVGIFRNISRLVKLIKQFDVDILHVRSRAPAWSCFFAAKKTGVALVSTFHGTYNFGGRVKKFYNAIMTRTDRVITNSEFIKQHLMNNYPVDASKLRVIPRGVDPLQFDPENVSDDRTQHLAQQWKLSREDPIILLPGRLTAWKGQLLLVHALANLNIKVQCLLVGSAQGRLSYVQEIMDLADHYQLGSDIHIIEDCTDIPAAMKLADVVVSASTEPEAFGRVTAEAQAMGKPVVAPNHGGAIEQISRHNTGWLFEYGNPADLAKQIIAALLITPEEREELYLRCIDNVEKNYTQSRMCQRTLAVYRELLDEKRLER